ncbi:MAG: tRNA pseudouridine(38-40) synthase TruA [Nitrospirae bacterium]|nr:tRNA pseudouridine(38-40) synthase TruA [Nitrospirota bacterium]
MRYIKLLIEYDGTNYLGWQTQKSGGTIQDILINRISSITGERVRLTGASRTDSGVHALGQVAVFNTGSELPADVFIRALNAKLPHDIRIIRTEETDGDFHPRYRAIRKSYFYLISNGRLQSAFLHKYIWDTKTTLDLELMKKASSALLGEHDFSSFMGSGCSSRHQVRTMYSLNITRLEEISFMTAAIKGDFIKIRLDANAFLRHMVRNIVGTLVEIGKGKIPPEGLHEILLSRDRTKAGPTAPAKGLFLEEIRY